MKIVCDKCGAKYAIPDDKVQGKAFKIRCKKCENVIMVRTGGEGTAQAAAAPVSAVSGVERSGGLDVAATEAVAPTAGGWHVVVGREQLGPMSAEEIRQRFSRGEITGDSYVWREGFTDWVRLKTVEDFEDLSQATRVSTQAAQPSAAAMPGMIVEPLAAAVQTQVSAPQLQQQAVLGTGGGGSLRGDLFASSPGHAAIDFGGGPSTGTSDMSASSAANPVQQARRESNNGSNGGASTGMQDASRLTGQRGENSVLFSLANLKAMAVSDPMSSQPAQRRAADSGLIDIQALAGGSVAASSPSLAIPPVAAAPILMASPSSDRPKWLIPIILGFVLMFVLVLGLAAYVVLGRNPQGVAQNAMPPETPPPAPTAGTTDPHTKTPPVAKPTQAETRPNHAATATNENNQASASGAETPEDTEPTKSGSAATATRDSGRGKPSGGRRPGGKPGATSSSGSRVDPRNEDPAPPPPTKPAKGGKKDDLDNLIDDAVGGGDAPAKRPVAKRPEPSGTGNEGMNSNLPDSLTPGQIQGGMRSVKGNVQGCFDQFKVPGLANVELTVGNDGRVSSTKMVGVFAGTPTGACVLSAVRGAKFPPFRGSAITFKYPFILR